MNDPTPVLSPAWSTFARSFSSTLGLLKNDFRIDLAGRVAAMQPGVARGRKECIGGTNQGKLCQVDSDCPGSTCAASGKFAFVWKDQRNGHYDAYTRVMRVW